VQVVKRLIVTAGWLLALGTAPFAARADIYAFTDPAGVTHFSNVPDDSRYLLIIKSPVDATHTPATDTRTAAWLARSIERAARAATVHPALVRAVIVIESGFNPRAISRRGAVGLMQLLPATARRYGAFNAFDPEQNIRAGARYLSDLLARFGPDKLELVLAAYNAGENAVEKYGRRIPPYAETKRYVPNVLKMYNALRAQSAPLEPGSKS
jgi:soluble lytic murein transglycosylase-like protein